MLKKFKKSKIKIILFSAVFLALAILGYKSYSQKNNFEFKNPSGTVTTDKSQNDNSGNSNSSEENKNFPISPITGERCENANRRPIAVMLATDRETRPLSGIASADMVFEMTVFEGGATRLAAIFQCDLPNEIGSARSARHDFIPLAQGLDAIYAHWGGSHFALDKLKTGAIDNLDALVNPYSVFFRKKGIPAPHNGFTSGELLLNASEKLGYRLTNKFDGYPHSNLQTTAYNLQTIKIGYPGEFKVEYQYDAVANSYFRWRGGTKEIDKNTGEQVSVKNVAVMYAESRQVEDQYNDVDIVGQGKAEFYLNGEKIDGIWKKDSEASKLYFLDNSGAEIKFAPGNIWVEIIKPELKVKWREE